MKGESLCVKGGIPQPRLRGIPAPLRGGRGPGAPSELFGGGVPPPPPMDPSPLLALLLLLLGAARALSTCQRLDLEAAKKKRIEAVRGQILSKLRLTAPPPASETPPRPLPDDVRALYNSTQELLKQRARLRPPPDGPDEYWAKELRRIPMETTWDGELGWGGEGGGGPVVTTGGDGVTPPCPITGEGVVLWGCSGVTPPCLIVGGSRGVTALWSVMGGVP